MTLAALLGALFLKPALVLAAAAATTACLRRRSAAARHAVWAGAILATLALPFLSVALPPLRIQVLSDAIERALPGAPRSGAAAATAADTGAPPAPTDALRGTAAPNRVRVGGAGAADRLAPVVVVVWILGALLLGVRRIKAEVRVRRILRRGRLVSRARLSRRFTELTRSIGTRRAVELRLSDETTSPAVAGVLRPVVLLPAAADTWADADLVAVLVHELGHVARRDSLVNLLADLATTMYWGNPVLRVAVRRMKTESERACDDRVLQRGAEPEEYAHLLLRVAGTARGAGGLPDAGIAMARPRELESRLLAVLDPQLPRGPLAPWMVAAIAGLGILVALPAAALTFRPAPLEAAELASSEPDRQADSLARPASERLPVPAGAYRVSLGAAQALGGPDSVLARRLVAALGHEPEGDADLIRDRAAWALSQARDGHLVEPLLDALDARDWRVQAYAAWALAAARDPRAVPRLVPLLGHPVWRLRAMVAYALHASRDPRAEGVMETALTDPAWQVRVEAVEYFAALGGATLSQRLRRRLADRHVAVRLAAAAALSR